MNPNILLATFQETCWKSQPLWQSKEQNIQVEWSSVQWLLIWNNLRTCRINPQFGSMATNKDHCQTMLDQRLIQQWSVWIGIDLYWEELLFIDRKWSAMIFIEPHCMGSLPEVWSLLISIDRHTGLIQQVLNHILAFHKTVKKVSRHPKLFQYHGKSLQNLCWQLSLVACIDWSCQ